MEINQIFKDLQPVPVSETVLRNIHEQIFLQQQQSKKSIKWIAACVGLLILLNTASILTLQNRQKNTSISESASSYFDNQYNIYTP